MVRSCGACAIWKLDPVEKMTAHGYGLCPHLPSWQYTAAHMPCQTKPIQWREKP